MLAARPGKYAGSVVEHKIVRELIVDSWNVSFSFSINGQLLKKTNKVFFPR